MHNAVPMKHNPQAALSSPHLYFQRSPFVPQNSKMASLARQGVIHPGLANLSSPFDAQNPEALENIDPLEWVSIPDLFFGENYQNMLPSLDIPAPPDHGIDQVPNQMMNYPGRGQLMQAFPIEKVNDFKHVIYNLLVENHNNPHKSNFVQPCTLEENGVVRHGFCFNEAENPEKKLPELYAQHIRKARLDQEDISSVFVHDLYKFYLRASVELLSKYFEKRDKYTYLYEDVPLFLPNGTLEQAEERIRNMKTRARKKRKLLPN